MLPSVFDRSKRSSSVTIRRNGLLRDFGHAPQWHGRGLRRSGADGYVYGHEGIQESTSFQNGGPNERSSTGLGYVSHSYDLVYIIWRGSTSPGASYRHHAMLSELNPDNAWIFRITHIQNVPWILSNGLHSKNSPQNDPRFNTIGNPDLIAKRASRSVPIPPGGTLSDYIPFYFTPLSPMMYNIVTGYGGIRMHPSSAIVIMVSSLRDLANTEIPAIYTDRHAYLRATRFFSSLDDLDQIDWIPLRRRDFRRDVDNPGKTARYQSEALVHQHLPVEHLSEIVCYDNHERELLEQRRDELQVNLMITVKRRWYF